MKAKRKHVSYTQKTLARLRNEGAVVDTCERWITIPNHPGGGVRKDLFGMFDLIAIRGGAIIGIQSTSEACRGEHAKTLLTNTNLTHWFAAGGKVELWTWKKKPMGGTTGRNTYTLRISEVTPRKSPDVGKELGDEQPHLFDL